MSRCEENDVEEIKWEISKLTLLKASNPNFEWLSLATSSRHFLMEGFLPFKEVDRDDVVAHLKAIK